MALMIEPVAPVLKRIEAQSPTWGEVALPSPLVSPPASTLSSRNDVNTTFWVAVPSATSRPTTFTNAGQPPPVVGWNFTATPGEMVKVAPPATVICTQDTTYGMLTWPQVTASETVPVVNVPLVPVPVAVLPLMTPKKFACMLMAVAP